MTSTRDFIDFWVHNSVHPKEELGSVGASQNPRRLAEKLVAAAGGQGISEAQLIEEIGPLENYLAAILITLNKQGAGRAHRLPGA
ncbi:MAG: hypothetical protein K2W78_02460 [Xanthobacteraceae bacterium]|nr:hypothetical protein [Xanthobacteraceae bacterium]